MERKYICDKNEECENIHCYHKCIPHILNGCKDHSWYAECIRKSACIPIEEISYTLSGTTCRTNCDHTHAGVYSLACQDCKYFKVR